MTATKVITPTYNVVDRRGLWIVVRRSVAGDVRQIVAYPHDATAEAVAHDVASTLNRLAWRETP